MLYALRSGSEMTSALTRALPHPPSTGMSHSESAANLLVEKNVGYGEVMHFHIPLIRLREQLFAQIHCSASQANCMTCFL